MRPFPGHGTPPLIKRSGHQTKWVSYRVSYRLSERLNLPRAAFHDSSTFQQRGAAMNDRSGQVGNAVGSNRPPRVPGAPLLGNTGQLLADPETFFPAAYQRHGPVFRVRVAGSDYTVLAGPEAFEFFMAEGERHFSRGRFYKRFGQELGTDRFILGEPADSQKDLRAKMRLGFSRQVTAAYVPQLLETARRAVDAVPEGQSLSAMDFAARVTFEQYGHVLCGQPLREDYPDAARYTQFIMNVGTKLWPEAVLAYPPYKASRRRILRRTQQLLDQARRRTPDTETPYTILDALLSAHGDDGEPLADEDLVACALYGFVGTLIYMNRAIAFLLHDLLANETHYRRAQAEADQLFAGGDPSLRDLRGLSFLRAAFKESLRRHPIALALPFVAEEAFDFAGYRVAAGDYVALSGVPGHFSQTAYRCPWAFDPERMQPPRSEYRARGAYTPFGFSDRFCPASGLVETMTLATVATLLHRRELSMAPPGYRLRPRLRPLPGPSRAFRIRFGAERRPEPAEAGAAGDAEALAAALGIGQEGEHDEMLARAEARTFGPGETVVRQGDPAEAFYIIAEGGIEVVREAEAGAAHLAHLGPGDYFGEVGLLEAGTRTATCRVGDDGPARLLTLARPDFMTLVGEADLVSDEIAALARRRFLANRLQAELPSTDPEKLVQGLQAGRSKPYPAGATVIRQGEPADAFFVIRKGQVAVSHHRGDGTEATVAELGPGQFFGEIGLLQGRPRTATVRVGPDSDAELLVFDRAEFESLLAQTPGAGRDLAAAMAQRLVDGLANR